jgi:D-alanyl-D-alanine carboxypeptidase
LLAVAVDANGKPLAHGEAEIVMGVASPPGEARWQEVAAIFERAFPAMQHAARESALAKLQANAQALAQKRKELAAVLREDAERYRTDRLTEIEKEERDSKLAEEKGQVLLLETRDVSGFQKRRAAVDTFHKQRLDEIAAYEKVPDPEPPQPLGVVFVLPAKP